MPVDMSRYPPNWKEISLEIRRRSKGFCECTGECGTHEKRCTAENYMAHPVTGSRVILTVAHLGADYQDGTKGNKHNKMDVRKKNLKAMCQRCHLLFDMDEHKANARATRRRKILESGQQEMKL